MEERHNIPTELISAMAPSQGMDAFSDEVSLMLMEGNPVASTTGGFGKKKDGKEERWSSVRNNHSYIESEQSLVCDSRTAICWLEKGQRGAG